MPFCKIGVENEGSLGQLLAEVWACRVELLSPAGGGPSITSYFDDEDSADVGLQIFGLISSESASWRARASLLLHDAFKPISTISPSCSSSSLLSVSDALYIVEHLRELLACPSPSSSLSTPSANPSSLMLSSGLQVIQHANMSRAEMRGFLSLLNESNSDVMKAIAEKLARELKKGGGLKEQKQVKEMVYAPVDLAVTALKTKRLRDDCDNTADVKVATPRLENLPKEADKTYAAVARNSPPKALPTPDFPHQAPPVAADEQLLTTFRKRGDDPLPTAPMDPEHPQRVMECSCDKLCRRMFRGVSEGSSHNFFFADTKYDGERLIGFKTAAGGTRFYSRNMKVVPDRKLDRVADNLAAAFGATAEYVFDAEILSMHTFGSMNEVKKTDIFSNGPLVYVFDLIWYNGHSLASLPLVSRRCVLQRLMRQIPGKVELPASLCIFPLPEKNVGKAKAEDALQQLFNQHMAKNLEGLVLKPAWAPYSFGGTHWVKVKRNYIPIETCAQDSRAKAVTEVTRVGGGRVNAQTLVNGVRQPVVAAARRSAEAVLNDTMDVALVGWHEESLSVLCAVYHKAKAQYVTCGLVRLSPEHQLADSPIRRCVAETFVPFSKSKRRASNLLVVHESLGWLDRAHPIYAIDKWHFDKSCLDSIIVVEVTASALVESWEQSCDAIALGKDARIVRLREDKDASCLTSAEDVVSLFAEGTAASALDRVAFVEAAVRRFNDMHWDAPAPAAPVGAANVLRENHLSAVAAVKLELGKELTSENPVVHILIVPVVPQRPWLSAKGTMGEVSAAFGDSAASISNNVLGTRTSAFGDVCAAHVCCRGEVSSSISRRCGAVVVPVAAVKFESTRGIDGGAARAALEPSVLGVIAVRIASLVHQLGVSTLIQSRPCFGAVQLHIDCGVFRNDTELWTAAFADLLQATVLPNCSLVIHLS